MGILSHQELQQLHDPDVESALLSNAGTRICFRLGDKDAKVLSEGFVTFEAEDLRNLKTGEAICRVGRSDDDFNLKIEMAGEFTADEADSKRAQIFEHTRRTYATERNIVEAEIARDRAGTGPIQVAQIKPPAAPKIVESLAEKEVQFEEAESEIPPVVVHGGDDVLCGREDTAGVAESSKYGDRGASACEGSVYEYGTVSTRRVVRTFGNQQPRDGARIQGEGAAQGGHGSGRGNAEKGDFGSDGEKIIHHKSA